MACLTTVQCTKIEASIDRTPVARVLLEHNAAQGRPDDDGYCMHVVHARRRILILLDRWHHIRMFPYGLRLRYLGTYGWYSPK
jgi:hypothetical protein